MIEDGTRVAALREVFRSNHGFLKDVVDRIAATFGPGWVADFDETLTTLFATDDALAAAAKGYAKFVMHQLREMKRFEKERAYPAKSYAQAAEEVYFDRDYMMSEYLPGLLLSHFLWPHHYHQLRFFETAYLAHLQLADEVRFVEVGVGTGLYSRRVLQRAAVATGTAFDISPASQEFAAGHIARFGFTDRFDVQLKDVVGDATYATDWLMCIEVLEHLEDPVGFLRGLRVMLRDGGRAFITAALNAPHVDHIYLYRTADEVIVQLEAAGFTLEQGFIGAAYKPATPDLPVPTVAAFVVI